jgi:uncharacterized protein (TIGR02145 family)
MQKIIFLVTLFMITTIIYSQTPCPDTPTVSYSGKTYTTVKIGSQCWLKENLDVGTMIQRKQNQTNNGIIEKYCYNDSTINCDKYGGLYQWAEAVQYLYGAADTTSPTQAFTGNVQGICPTGWHIPTITELGNLSTFNYTNDAVKAIGQGKGEGTATNKSGFSALLAGYRDNNSGFFNLGNSAYIWSSLEFDAANAQYMDIFLNNSNFYFNNFDKRYGISVRCLKD